MSDIRASELEVGMTYEEFGIDGSIQIAKIGMHGDRVLITGTDGIETSLDRDEVVDLLTPEETPEWQDYKGTGFPGEWPGPEPSGLTKLMRPYLYVNSHIDGGDPRFYENNPTMHDKTRCTVWTLHMNVYRNIKDVVLARLARHSEVTGEYTFGDSWKEWGGDATDDLDQHLAVYFVAHPTRAATVGAMLASTAYFAARVAGAPTETLEALLPYGISTSGDYAEQLRVS